MAKISYNKLQRIRSGQGVWRVYFIYNSTADELIPMLDYRMALGEKSHHWQSTFKGSKPTMVFPRGGQFFHNSPAYNHRFKVQVPTGRSEREWLNSQSLIWSISDTHGDACFTKKPQAERYIKDVLEGRYPALFQSRKDCELDLLELDKLFPEEEEFEEEEVEIQP